jgi:hypothetical protein
LAIGARILVGGSHHIRHHKGIVVALAMQVDRYLPEDRRAVSRPEIPPPALDHVPNEGIVVAKETATISIRKLSLK